MKRRLATAGLSTVALLVTISGPGNATASNAGQIPVTATVSQTCVFNSASTAAFGAYDPIDVNSTAPLDATFTSLVSITCTNGTTVDLSADTGAHNGLGGAGRSMQGTTNTSDYLNYELYTDSPGGTVWANTGNLQATATATGLAQNITVYGRIPAGQNTVHADSFTDTVNITVFPD